MTETRFAVRVPHTMRVWYVLMDFPDGTTELMVIVGNSGEAPHTLDTTLTLEDIRTWGLQDYDRIKVQVTERKAEDEKLDLDENDGDVLKRIMKEE